MASAPGEQQKLDSRLCQQISIWLSLVNALLTHVRVFSTLLPNATAPDTIQVPQQ